MPEIQPPAAYLRQPTVQGETLVFVSDDDLWRVGLQGGVAHRLTAGLSEPATPCLSPCGQWLAYTGRDEQHAEAWLMPTAGGPARRLTWLGSELAVRGWSPEGRIVFSSNHGQPFFRNFHAWTLGLVGGEPEPWPERVPLGAIDHLAFGPGGRRVIGRNTGDPARWKRYRGGRVGQLWMESASEPGQFTRLAALPGNVSCPMWLGERLYFIGDHEGVGNIYSCRPDASDLRRHTAHTDFYARHASSDGRRIVYQCGAELWLLQPGSESRRLDIQVPGARTQAARRFVPAAEHLQGLQLHPAGHSLALEVRGQLHTLPLWEGAPQRHGSGGRRRLGQWLADGRTLVCTSDASGEERLEVHDGGAPRELPWAPEQLGRVTSLRAAPAAAAGGTRVALANHRNELWVGDVASGQLQRADHSAYGRIEDLAWSPCGRWLAYACPTSARHTAIKLCEVGESGPGRTLLASEPAFRDWSPSFDPEGRYLYFLSLRTFDPVYDSVQFELSFPRGARPYLIALQADGPPPFDPPPRGLRGERDDERADRDAPCSPRAWRDVWPPSPCPKAASARWRAWPGGRWCGPRCPSPAPTAAAATRTAQASWSSSTSPPAT
jgi:tricorn protease